PAHHPLNQKVGIPKTRDMPLLQTRYPRVMKAAILYETKKPLAVEDVQLEGPKNGEVLVKIAAAGVCHSDYHFMNGDLPIGLPCVLGHEGAGVVEEVGAGVTTVKPGDHVVLLFRAYCGH